MSGDAVRKLTAGSGIAAVVLLGISAALMPGDVPGFDATSEQVVNYALDHRRAQLIATVLIATAFTLLVVFYAGLRTMLGRAEGAPALLSTVGYGAFLIVIALGLVAMGVAQAQAFVALDGDPATVKVLHELRLVLINLSGVPTILSAAAIGVVMVRARFPARWAGWLSFVAGAAHVLAVVALARTGFFSPTGAGALIGPVIFLVWILAVSALLLRLPRRAGAHPNAGATAGA